MGEYYHIYLRGVEKRNIVMDNGDLDRFLLSLRLFNSAQSVGSIYEHSFRKDPLGSETSKSSELVEIVAFNVLPNHYHLLLRQRADEGISRFMQRFNGGYTKYFNNRYDRVGALFQGVFQSVHIPDEMRLAYVSAYVNLNHIVHRLELGSETSKWGRRSSWEQYVNEAAGISDRREYAVPCSPHFVLSLYKNKKEYVQEAEEIARMIADRREKERVEEDVILQDYLEVSLPSGRMTGGI